MSHSIAETAIGQCRRNASNAGICCEHGGSADNPLHHQLSGAIEVGQDYNTTQILKMLNLLENHVFFYHASHGDHSDTSLKLMTVEEFEDNAYLQPEFIRAYGWEVEYDDEILRLYFSGSVTVRGTSSESYVIRGLSRVQVKTFLQQINLGEHLEYLFRD